MAPAGLRLVLCEERIREKSGLAAHRDLAELQSLCLPGTYQEKITHLGNSLMNLTGLKSLDLSRNSLVSLEGIQYLTALERLNLYYNCISSLAEVFRLHSLLELTDVDFRLNPVVKNESDYRLFVVHMLPNLRQLDDRPVRESERKASRLHFTSEESLDSKQTFPAALNRGRPRRCRAKGADSLSKCLVLDADDEAVLNLIAECEWDLSNPPGSTGSSQRERETDLSSSQESRHVLSPQSAQHQCGDSIQKGPERRKSTFKGGFPEKQPQVHCCGEQPNGLSTYLAHFLFPPQPDPTDREDSVSSSHKSSVSTQKAGHRSPVSEKYRKHRLPDGRFQGSLDQECPGCFAGACGPPSSEESLTRPDGSESTSERTSSQPEAPEAEEPQPRSTSAASEHLVMSPHLCTAAPPSRTTTLETALLESLLDLVDRHWGGRRSLHSNQAFLGQMRHLLSSVQALTAAQNQAVLASEAVSRLALENESLHRHLEEQQQQHSASVDEARRELEVTRKETDALRERLDKSLEENSSLKSLLFSMKREAKSSHTDSTLNVQIAGLQTSVKRLSGEIVELKQHLEHYDKIQELTQMLQESHSSLVSTNEHLLQELGHTRALHRAEVEQLHWSYQELKKTMALFPARSTGPSGC
ncbi:PREDICTED: centrosomal protein of 72 kDa [Chrysochloris asiatica]|uniref:Centrosomal protein of 72 kDa n=1 Tax=Chrysochloris asiatica TaxID=185453 RepID=A0A9B0U4P1_CHRAS|nr:PREDICTED: centrosomal protein of 72 kDa [Chrysochloris asiatica]